MSTILTDLVNYQKDVLSQFLLPDFVDVPNIVNLSLDQVSRIQSLIEVGRPPHRLQKSIPVKEMPVLLLPDYCALPSGLRNAVSVCGSVIGVEIKPKQGFRNPRDGLPAASFCLKQFQKMKLGSISCHSCYCPLDLFSGCPVRQREAIQSLIHTPQNNFRIFKDLCFAYGEEVRGSLSHILSGTFADSNRNDDEVTESFIRILLKALNSSTHSSREDPLAGDKRVLNEESFCQVHSQNSVISCSCSGHTIASHSVLGNVLRGQRLDTVSCHEALEMAQCLYSRNCDFMSELKDANIRWIEEANQAAGETREDFYFRQIWQYFVSLTLKDCSILITMQRLSDSHHPDVKKLSEYRYRLVTDDRTGVSFVVSVAIVDLDPRFPQSFEQLKQKILQKDFSAIKITDPNANEY